MKTDPQLDLENWQLAKDRLEEARHRRRCRCAICGCLHEPGHSCRHVTYNKSTGKFDHK